MKINKRFLLIPAIMMSVGQVFCQMVILSGPEKGSYNRFANDIVTVLGEKDKISLINRPTAGSGFNFKELTDPGSGYKIAIIQSDYLNLMIAEDKLNNTNKAGSVKVLLQLAREEIQMVSKKSSGLNNIQDLDNKKVSIGSKDQGSFATGKIIRERSKINWTPYYTEFDQLIKQLANGNIDAGLVVGSAPMEMLDVDPQIMADGITMLEMDDFNGWAKYYENDTVYQRDYKWLDKDVPTFGVRTLLVVNESKLTATEKKTVGAIKSGIIQNLELLKQKGHPKWKEVIIPDEPGIVPVKNAATDKAADKAPDQISGKDAVNFRVQIYSRNYQKKDDKIIVGGKSYNAYVYPYMGAYRYTIGEFKSVSEATELQNSCRESGYPEAFIAAFINNVRTTDMAYFK